MGQYRKQHIIPETYLKYFSILENGKSIYVVDFRDKYRKYIQERNEGDVIFKQNNFYNSDKFDNPTLLEEFFGQKVESTYHSIIKEIKKEKEISEWAIKLKLLQWIFYSKLRSPVWRQYFLDIIDDIEKGKLKVQVEQEERQELIEYFIVNKDILSKELHLDFFTNDEKFDTLKNKFTTDVMSKRWRIIKRPENSSWWTTDNPGFGIQLDSKPIDGMIIPNPFWKIRKSDTILYYPLTKDYCLEIYPYDKGESLKLNLHNTPIQFQLANESDCRRINFWTLITNYKLLISCESKSLETVVETMNLEHANSNDITL